MHLAMTKETTRYRMHNEKTIVIVAHRLSTVVKSDWIVVVDNGQIIEQGTPEELVKMEGHFADIWSLQANSLVSS